MLTEYSVDTSIGLMSAVAAKALSHDMTMLKKKDEKVTCYLLGFWLGQVAIYVYCTYTYIHIYV